MLAFPLGSLTSPLSDEPNFFSSGFYVLFPVPWFSLFYPWFLLPEIMHSTALEMQTVFS